MTVKDLIYLDRIEYPDPDVLRNEFSDITEEQWNFLQAFITCKKDPRPWEDFYVFEDVVTALNYEIPDFSTLEPPSAEQLWHGIKLMKMIMPKMAFSFEVKTYAKRVFNEHGVYFYPEEIDNSESNKKILNKIETKAESGPFPLKDDNTLDIQASHFLALKLYHEIEMGKNIKWIDRELIF